MLTGDCKVPYFETTHSKVGKNPTYHQQAVVAKRVAGYGGEVVMVAQDVAAVALPSSVASHQAEVPGGGHGVRAVGKPPQGDINRRPQDVQRRPLWQKTDRFSFHAS